MTATLAALNVTRHFGATRALNNVSLSVAVGEVIGLIGENGAGKSTLLNILSGVISPDSGKIVLEDREVVLASPREAAVAGIFHIHQHLALVPNLTVAENLYLSHDRHFSRFGVIDHSAMRSRARRVLSELGHAWIDPTREIRHFSFSERQIIEIIKAFALAELLEVQRPVLLLDEPTAALAHSEVDFLFRMIRSIKDRAAVVFVSHRLNEVVTISDRIYVLRDGVVTGEADPSTVTDRQQHELMGGRTFGDIYHQDIARNPGDRSVLTVRGSSSKAFTDVSFDVCQGEIVGLAGLLGSGKSEVGKAIFGLTLQTDGTIAVDDTGLPPGRVLGATSAGVGYLPQDRQTDGIMSGLPVSWNITLAAVAGASRFILDLREEKATAQRYVTELGIKTRSVMSVAGSLSGGNQQKVMLARWLSKGARLLVLDNPTQGVDSGAKQDMYSILRAVAAQGVAILLISDDLPELIGLSDRIVVMKAGRVVAELEAKPENKPSEVQLIGHMA